MTDKQAVEKVARALYVLWRGSGRIWEDTSPHIKTQFRKDARAAIAAYHEHLGFDPKDVVAAATSLLSRKDEGPSEDAHIFGERDDLRDALSALRTDTDEENK